MIKERYKIMYGVEKLDKETFLSLSHHTRTTAAHWMSQWFYGRFNSDQRRWWYTYLRKSSPSQNVVMTTTIDGFKWGLEYQWLGGGNSGRRLLPSCPADACKAFQ